MELAGASGPRGPSQTATGVGAVAQASTTTAAVWTYNCSAFGSSGNFITSITGYGGAEGTTDAGANQLGTSGSGTNHYYDTGTFSIDVNSECSWTDEAVSVP
jgi:hypothetical protein